ncbi:MAG TPA: tetratricopeptide repeat protein [Aliidongia sp.]|uniref:tetratricopeptide repeat protein n=1 Tax=Aliidongia sp. TaxID=1914230 RepID=UPI002DDCEB05|nr:tetratricopeptide repeat protein [Aliidongia sp.]HEV2673810.1 tetratricopeptide repeat protein [Aliidongia sp.]
MALVALLALGACAEITPSSGASGLADSGNEVGQGQIDTHRDLPSSHSAYLIGLVAQNQHDFADSLAFYQAALAQDPTNGEIAGHLFVLAIVNGKLDMANKLTEPLLAANPSAPLVNLLAIVEDIKAGRLDEARAAAARLPRQDVYRVTGALTRAWLAAGKPAGAEPSLQELEAVRGFGEIASLHRALILDQAGDRPGAEAAYRSALGEGAPVRVVQLVANFLTREGKPDEAAALYPKYLGATEAELGFPLPNGAVPAPLVPDTATGVAEALFDLGNLMNGADAPNLALLNARLALELKPDFPEARIVLAQAFEAVKRPDLAREIYASLDPATTLGWTARLRIAALKQQDGDGDGARADLNALAAQRPDRPEPLVELGNSLSADKRYPQAIAAYDQAFGRIKDPDTANWWGLYYTRGTAYERARNWPKAETDLRKALALEPNQPSVMNYLGYSMVDRGDRLPEALKLIKGAVSQRPDDGYIVDSLGWAYYRLGDYKNAETTLEHAVELKPADAEINAHLGDAYWQGGRRDEARLQWQRALGLNPEPDLAKAIEAKLDKPPARAPSGRAKPAKHAAEAEPAPHGGT